MTWLLEHSHQPEFIRQAKSLPGLQKGTAEATTADSLGDEEKLVADERTSLASDSKPPATRRVVFIKLDHMRQKTSYVKILKKWASQLGISGRVLFPPKNVFIIIDGLSDSIDEFLRLLRTQKVDVNSKGEPCKERESDILAEHSMGTDKASPLFASFRPVDIINDEGLLKFFEVSCPSLTKWYYIAAGLPVPEPATAVEATPRDEDEVEQDSAVNKKTAAMLKRHWDKRGGKPQ